MKETEISEFTKKLIVNQLNACLKSYQNPDLLIAILGKVRSVSSYADTIQKSLDIPEEQMSHALDYLVLNGFIRMNTIDLVSERRLVELYLTKEGEVYWGEGDIIGPYYLIGEENLNKENMGRVMNGVRNLVIFRYVRDMKIPSIALRPLKKQISASVEQLWEQEKKFVMDLLGLSESEKLELGCLFVTKKDSTKYESHELDSVECKIYPDYNSPDEALDKGFTRAWGVLRSNKPIMVYGREEYDIGPGFIIEKNKEERYKLEVTNRLSWIIRDTSFACIQEAKSKMKNLVDVINLILSK